MGVVQIEITAATPMVEDVDKSFPPSEDSPCANHVDEEGDEEEEQVQTGESKKEIEVAEEQATESSPLPISSSTGSDGETTGPSTAENSISQTGAEEELGEAPKQVIGGRASIPDELEPHQLAQLQDLKESNA